MSRTPWLMGVGLALALAMAALTVSPQTTLLAQSSCGPAINPIVCENQKPGNLSTEWDINGAGDSTIQGFATDISVVPGQTQRFKIKTTSNNYTIGIYRLGYYGGMGARKIASISPSVALPQSQPACLSNATTGLVDCGNWAVSASWTVPAGSTSGIYFALLTRIDTGGQSHIFFVVRDDTGNADIVFQTSDTTWQAYNQYGGNSLYVGSPAGRAYKVSYNRPFTTRGTSSEDWVFNAEYPMVRWLEANGFNVSYISGIDTDRYGATILTPAKHKVFVSVGHDEYWSGAQRANVEAARSAGLHLAFFSGNEVFWKTRWENSIDGSGTPYRTLVAYKETHANAKIDPLANVWTGTWRDPRFSPPADGGRPENALTGTIFKVNGGTSSIRVPASFGKARFWRNTSVATLPTGGVATLPNGTLGYEWDEEANNGFRPEGLMRLSSTTVSGVEILLDYGSTYGTGTATHNLTLYRHASGALVFGAGTIQWPWGLDSEHDRGSAAPDVRMQQATVNLFADMRAQPDTLQPGLVAATASTDTFAPISTISFPTSGSTFTAGSQLTIAGTASDSGGGIVAGVEVSTDNGVTWVQGNGTTSWTFNWTVSGSSSATIRTRAFDDSGNLETPSGGVTINISTSWTCPCSIWSSSTVPPAPIDDNDPSSVELGTKFRSDSDGYITAVRFYKGSSNTGTHTGKLWTRTGTLLGSVTFAGETASGWQQANFASPIPISAGTTYIVSYHAPNGHYTGTDSLFANSVDRPPLHALRDGVDGPNGLYAYSSSSVFPTNTYNSEAYWVDVVFNTVPPTDTTPPTITSRSPAPGATGVDPTASVTATFSEAMSAATISSSTFELRDPSSNLITATVSYDSATRVATLDPTGSLGLSTMYTALVKGGSTDPRVKDSAGNAMAGNISWSFTTATAADTTPPSITSMSPTNGAISVDPLTQVTTTFSEAMNGGTITSSTFELRAPSSVLIPATVSYDSATRIATLDATSNLAFSTTYTALVKGGATDPRVKDLAGNAIAANVTWSFTTATAPPPSGCPCSIWSPSTVPSQIDDGDPAAVELGTKFRSDVAGYVTGARFYKGPLNTGTHVARLWTATGTQLASATFASETASAWQQVAFPSPIAIAANTTYVISYHAPNGHYSAPDNYFQAAGVDNPPLHALRNGVDGPNGVYAYGPSGSFPNDTYLSESYFVDVVFNTTVGP